MSALKPVAMGSLAPPQPAGQVAAALRAQPSRSVVPDTRAGKVSEPVKATAPIAAPKRTAVPPAVDVNTAELEAALLNILAKHGFHATMMASQQVLKRIARRIAGGGGWRGLEGWIV